jgi:hypothetical protein
VVLGDFSEQLCAIVIAQRTTEVNAEFRRAISKFAIEIDSKNLCVSL